MKKGFKIVGIVAMLLLLLVGAVACTTEAEPVEVVVTEEMCTEFIPVVEIIVCPEVDELLCAEYIVECPVVEECPVYGEEFVSTYDAESLAEEVVLAELEDEDLLEDVWVYMVDIMGLDIDDMDEIVILEVRDSDVDLSDEDDGEGEVLLELKVGYILDGDDDDDHTERVDVTFELDDFEVDSYTIEEH